MYGINLCCRHKAIHESTGTFNPAAVLHEGKFVMLYRAQDANGTSRLSYAVIFRTGQPIFAPEKEWEKTGQVPNVVFLEGMVQREGRYLFYYGGADKYVGVAEFGMSLRR